MAFRRALTLFDDYHEMMSDPVRMTAYEQAIARVVESGDLVVDLGAGLGILSLLAARAGAAKVYAIEKGDAAELARAVVRRAGLAERIEILEANSLDVELPVRADVLISETLGSFGLDENTLEFTIDARERLLKPGARMLPCSIEPMLAPIEHPSGREKLDFWRDVAGFDYQPAIDEILGRMSLADVDPSMLLGAPQSLGVVDLRTVGEAQIVRPLRFEIARGGTLDGLGGWFRAELAPGTYIDTAPGGSPTHWRHAFFPFRDPVRVVEGDFLQVQFSLGPRGDHSDNTKVHYEFYCSQRGLDGSAGPRPRRRDPCPCGSGKTYVRCCGARASD